MFDARDWVFHKGLALELERGAFPRLGGRERGRQGYLPQCEGSHHLLALGSELPTQNHCSEPQFAHPQNGLTVPTSYGREGESSDAQPTGRILSVWMPTPARALGSGVSAVWTVRVGRAVTRWRG